MPMQLTHLTEGLRFFGRAVTSQFRGYRHYQGNDIQICRSIIKDCFQGEYFQCGAGNFNEFYNRDFGFCTPSLLRLGYKTQVKQTLEYAMKKFIANNDVSQSISPRGSLFDYPAKGPDSLAFFLHSLRLGYPELARRHQLFLEGQVNRFHDLFFDPTSGLVKKNLNVTSVKDNAIRSSSLYDNTMVAMLSRDLSALGFSNPFKSYNFQKIHKDAFWNGNYFFDDLSGKEYVAGDANIFPYWCKTFTSKNMFSSSLRAMQDANLDKPFPLKYTRVPIKDHYLLQMHLFAPNYAGNTIWMHLGGIFLQTLYQFKHHDLGQYLQKYKQLIEHHGNYLEVFNPNGSPYETLFYHTDEGMLWCSMYLDLVDRSRNSSYPNSP